LGPEMRSTGEVMGIDSDFGRAFAKAGWELVSLPLNGTVFVSMNDRDKVPVVPVVETCSIFSIVATEGAASSGSMA